MSRERFDLVGEVDLRLRVLCYRSSANRWIAQALEKDIAAEGADLREARAAFVDALIDNVVVGAEHGDPNLHTVPAAPTRFWQMWEGSEELRHPLPTNMSQVPPPWLINALTEMRVAG